MEFLSLPRSNLQTIPEKTPMPIIVEPLTCSKQKLYYVEQYLLHGENAFADCGFNPKAITMSDYGMYSPVRDPELMHFPSIDDRARASVRNIARNGRASPAHSAHGGLFRASLMKITIEKKAKKVRFYRNGDRFFKGMIYAVSPERFRTFESLMSELTVSPVCDKTILPKGVRYLFSLDGMRKISDLDELEDGESYVCASTQLFHKINYPQSSTPSWNPNIKNNDPLEGCVTPGPKTTEIIEDREFIKPRLITVVRHGAKPRKAVRILLNKKTAHSFEQVLTDITDAVKLDTGAVKKIYTIGGKPVRYLQDFFGDENVFVAYGNERQALDDLEIGDNDIKFGGAYRSVRQKERITLRSPIAPRRMPLSTSDNSTDLNRRAGTTSPRVPSSPSSPHRTKTPSGRRTPKSKYLTNGHTTNENGNSEPAFPSLLPPKLSHKYVIGKVVGEGNFATVKECMDKLKKHQYALKIIDKSKCHGKEKMIENEVSILRHVKNSNIIQLVEDFDTPEALYLVMELVTGGDLFDAISSATKYTERDASGMLYNLGCGIKYLHSLSIVHRDIKPENLLVAEYPDGSKALKLGDFGLSTTVTGPLYTVCGTPTYIAPEILAETGYGIPVDIWSSGVITYILLCGFSPFASPSHDQDELFEKIMSDELVFLSPFWDNISQSAKDLISLMLQKDPAERISAGDVLNHPWVSDDEAKDEDLHMTVSTRIGQNFTKQTKKFAEQPGVNLIASTALDKGSRYFQGKKSANNLSRHKEEDEVF